MQTSTFVKTLLCAVFFIAASHASAKTAHLTLHSQAGEYVGGGKDYDITYTPDNSLFFFADVYNALPSGAPTSLIFSLGIGQDTPFALLQFSTHGLGLPMQVGAYNNARRAADALPLHPGIDISFAHRGASLITGNFQVTDFKYSPTLGIQSFSASFEQRSGANQAALFGTFTYNDMPPAVPEPETYAMLFAGLGVIAALKRRQAKKV